MAALSKMQQLVPLHGPSVVKLGDLQANNGHVVNAHRCRCRTMADVPTSTVWTFATLALTLTLGSCWVVCRPLLRTGTGGEPPAISRRVAAGLSAALVAAVGLSYMRVGQWKALDVGPVSPASLTLAAPQPVAPPQVSITQPAADRPKDIRGLIAHMRQAPGDVEGWKQLAQGCERAGLMAQAVSAYQVWARLTTGDADTLAQYAVTLAMSKGQGLVGEPQALIERALKLSPRHETALGLAAEAALERRDDAAALGYFKRLEAALPADSAQLGPLRQRWAALAQRLGP
jgi:cytochrome c-type biogenesis protein CcmH